MTEKENWKKLDELREQAKLGGGEERIKAQHAKGKLTARERIELLVDGGTFEEIDMFVKHRTSGFRSEFSVKILLFSVVHFQKHMPKKFAK
jgi:propionyl-CoA carboxylase beta chain